MNISSSREEENLRSLQQAGVGSKIRSAGQKHFFYFDSYLICSFPQKIVYMMFNEC